MKKIFNTLSIRFRHILESRYIIIIAIVLGMLLTVSSIKLGLVMDDFVHWSKLAGTHPVKSHEGTIFGLFTFFDGMPENMKKIKEYGIIPWWFTNDSKMAFWRPLAEITHWLDYTFWPDKPWLMHVQSILWYALIILVSSIFYRRIIGTPWIAGFALLIFTFDNSHGLPVGWVANRNILIVAFFGILTMICHDTWRKQNWRPGLLLGLLSLFLAFCAGEATIGICAFLFAYTLFIDEGTVKERIFSLMPYTILGLGWLVFYKIYNFGAYQPGYYVDPFAHPLQYLQVTIVRLPVLLINLFMEPPAELLGLVPLAFSFKIWLVEIVITVLLAAVFWPFLKRSKQARFWGTALLLSLFPITTAIPNARILFVSTIAGMGFISCFVGFMLSNEGRDMKNRIWKVSAKVVTVLLIFFNVIFSPLHFSVQPLVLNLFVHKAFTNPCLAIPAAPNFEDRDIVMLNPPYVFGLLYFPFVRDYKQLALPASCRGLASGLQKLKLTRIGDNSITIEGVEAGQSIIELPAQIGVKVSAFADTYQNKVVFEDMIIEVLEVNKYQEPSKVLYTFKKPIDDPSFLMLEWKNNAFASVTFPDVGESMILDKFE